MPARASYSYGGLVATGGIILAAIMLVLFPVLIMFVGAIWSALVGWLLVAGAEHPANAAEAPAASE
jgi:membrane glycosyltransferase